MAIRARTASIKRWKRTETCCTASKVKKFCGCFLNKSKVTVGIIVTP